MPENDATANAGEQNDGFKAPQNQEELDRIIQRRLERERARFQDYDQLKEQVKTLQAEADSKSQAEKSLSEQLADFQKQIDNLKSENSTKDRELIVERVANAKNVPAKYLTGDSEEELTASADEYLQDLEAMIAAREQEQRPGYIPSQGTGDPGAEPSSFEAGAARARARHQKD